MKKHLSILGSVALIVSSQVSCTTDDAPSSKQTEENVSEVVVEQTPGEIKLSGEQTQMVDENCRFALQLMREASQENAQTMIMSPLSVAYTLGMLNDGANGNTHDEITHALFFDTHGTKTINCFFGNLTANAPLADEAVELGIANMLLANTAAGAQFSGQYAADMKGYYQADMGLMDFSQPDAVLAQVNGWCNSTTKGMIPNILKRGEISSADAVMMLNSAYFKAQWLHVFDKAFTEIADFTSESGAKVKMPMMAQTVALDYMEDETLKAVRLPYRNGKYSMILILPANKDLPIDDLLGYLTAERWKLMVSSMQPQNILLRMPRFSVTTELDMTRILNRMGVKSAFSSTDADFSGMLKESSIPVFVSKMKQSAKIETDEMGTMASAVTVSYVTTGKPNAEFVANRPFLFAITERFTNVIFFIGKVTETS